MYKKFATLFLLWLSVPAFVSAHVKWFAESNEYVRPYSFTDLPVLLWVALGIVIILVGVYLEKRLRPPRWIISRLNSLAPIALSLASIGFGLAFLIFSFNGFLFAPNLIPEGEWGNALLVLQAVAGGMILLGFYERVGALGILILFVLGIKEFGAYEMIDTLEMVGFAVYALIVGRPRWSLKNEPHVGALLNRFHHYGLPILRLGTGLNLIVLGFTEKILAPSLTSDFLAHYQWNFMQALGFEQFNNYWFAFSAGVVEVLFGIFFVLGLVTRLTTVALAVFLLSTLILLGPIELIGHLPHFSIAIALLMLGAGSRFVLITKHS